VYAAIAMSVWLIGPWSLSAGPLRASASSIAKPVLVSTLLAVVALAVSPRTHRAASHAWAMTFYVLAAVVTWVLALGPRPRVMGRAIGYDGPYEWVMLIPGGDGLRVPARFWMVTLLCLAIVAALFLAEVLRRKRGRLARVGVPVIALLVLADGWTAGIPVQPLPPDVPDAAALAGRTVLDLPAGDYADIAAQYRATRGGWRSVNGYSGYLPTYYRMLESASRDNLAGVLDALQPLGELNLVVARDAVDQQQLLRQQPHVTVTGENGTFTQFRLPQRPAPSRAGGSRVPITRLLSDCEGAALGRALDRNLDTYWVCGPELNEQSLTIDLGLTQVAGAVLHDEGPVAGNFPRRLVIETSLDGETWQSAWSGNAWGPAISAAMRSPKENHIWFVFDPRPARYIRLTHPPEDQHYIWAIAELEVWAR
jgi:hypothetical protein